MGITSTRKVKLQKGNITFLFTDIEGSTRLWEAHREAMATALQRHDLLLRKAIEAHEGHVFKTVGDAFCVAFDNAIEAIQAALDIERSIDSEPWKPPVCIKVRCGIHTGPAEVRDEDYFGPTLNRIARLLSLVPGGDAVLTAATFELVQDFLPSDAAVEEFGEFELKDLERPERLYRLVHLETVEAAPKETLPSLAVLPMVNMSHDEENEYFADGLTEEILNVLAKSPGLRVTSRTSAFSFKGKGMDLPAIAKRLQVRYVLEGSVRKAGNRARITMQLVDATKDAHLWSESYDRELEDIFAVQDEIARAVATKLAVSLGVAAENGEARRGTASLEAYDHFLKGRTLQRHRSLPEALEEFRLALILDSTYAEALGYMSDCYRLIGLYGVWPPAVVIPYARAAAERALAIDPNVAENHSAMAEILLTQNRDAQGAIEHWTKAIELSPSHSQSRCEYALWGMWAECCPADEALRQTSLALEMDPLNPWVRSLRAMTLALSGQLQEGIEETRRALEAKPKLTAAWWICVEILLMASRFNEAEGIVNEALRVGRRHPWLMATAAACHAGMGNPEGAAKLHRELIERAEIEFVQPLCLAATAASAGLDEEAAARAKQGYDEGDILFFATGTLGSWESLRKLKEHQDLWAAHMAALKKSF